MNILIFNILLRIIVSIISLKQVVMGKSLIKLLILSQLLLFVTFCGENIVESVSSIDENAEDILILPKFGEIQNKIFAKSCALDGCHTTGGVSPVLEGNTYQNIVDVPSSAGMDYIQPNQPNESYLLLKILGDAGIEGARMPLNRSPLSEAEIEAIIEWIKLGAENN